MWQYKVVNGGLSEEELNDLGSQGWELIAVMPGSFFFKKPS